MRGQVPGGLRMIIINNKPPPGRPGEGGMRGAVATAAERSPRPRPAVVQSGGPPPRVGTALDPTFGPPRGFPCPPMARSCRVDVSGAHALMCPGTRGWGS